MTHHPILGVFLAGATLIPMLVVVNVEDTVFDQHVRRLKEAMRLANLSTEKACLYLGIDKNQWRRQVEGREGHISFTRMMLLPSAFWQWYALLLAEDYGVPSCVARTLGFMLTLRSRRKVRSRGLAQAIERRGQARMDLATVTVRDRRSA